jgi:hypothetical protein
MLSPLSWWNDLVVNVPLALAFAWVISAFHRPAFAASFVVGYWLTNVLGFVLMHKGAAAMFSKPKPYDWKRIAIDVAISLAYTALILVLLKLKIIAPLGDYFPKH